jgi:uncharacterized protein (DUF2252 family)
MRYPDVLCRAVGWERRFFLLAEEIMRDVVREFMDYNRRLAQRSPELLRLKVARMAAGAFGFFRGSFHVFARDVYERNFGPLPAAVETEWMVVGDAHPENFGTFKGADGVVHYDLNDFDEATIARFDLDVCRLATGVFLASREPEGRMPLAEAVQVALAGVLGYVETLRRLLRKPGEPEPDPAEGRPSGSTAVDELISAKASAKRPDFINYLTEVRDGVRMLRRAHGYFNVSDAERERALRLLADYRSRHARTDVDPDYYKTLDVAGRVSGVGSMGRLRYVLLLRGKPGEGPRNVLLEFKEAMPSAFDVLRGRARGTDVLAKRAEQVIAAQRSACVSCSPHLGYAVDEGQSFQARELGPADERVDLAALKGSEPENVARVQGIILGRAHARAVVKSVGPASPLPDLLDADAFSQRVLAFALSYADRVRRDWERFKGAKADLENVAEWVKE